MNVEEAIRHRKTLKVLANPDDPWPAQEICVDELLILGSAAPFHYPCDPTHFEASGSSPVPWRFHVLAASECRRLLRWIHLTDWPAGKIANMLAAADALILTTWLPDPGTAHAWQGFTATQRNMEHISAAAAATQNVLLGATSRGWENYWSSGGVLRSERMYQWLGIPSAEILLAAIFLFPADTRGVPTKPGAHRGKQGPAGGWRRMVRLEGDQPPES